MVVPVVVLVNGNHKKFTYSFEKSFFSIYELLDLKKGTILQVFFFKSCPHPIQNYILSYLTTKHLLNLLFLKIPVTLNEILLIKSDLYLSKLTTAPYVRCKWVIHKLPLPEEVGR